MQPRCSHQRNRALTRVEVLVVIGVLAVIVAMFLPALAKARRKSSRIFCVNNLKQLGLAYRIWAGDNGDINPMGVSVTNGGSMEMVATGNVVQTFQVMSNELGTPKLLICPQDGVKSFATNFDSGFTAKNISYFVGLDAKTNFPQAFLSGDDNFEIVGVPVKSRLLEITTNTSIAWTVARHKIGGNILLVNGTVQSLLNTNLASQLNQTGLATNRLAPP